MRDHREGRDPAPVDITDQLRNAIRGKAGEASRVRITPPDWRLRRDRHTKQQTDIRKARRRQADQSRKRNR